MSTITDSFDRADESLSRPDNPTANWTDWRLGAGVAWAIVGNIAQPAAYDVGDCGVYYSAIPWTQHHYSQCKVTAVNTSGGLGPSVRVNDSRDMYVLVVNHAASNNISLQRVIDGANVAIATRTQAWADDDLWRLEVVLTRLGSVLTIKYLGTVLGATVLDNGLFGGAPGMGYITAGNSQGSINDWEGGDLFSGQAGRLDVGGF